METIYYSLSYIVISYNLIWILNPTGQMQKLQNSANLIDKITNNDWAVVDQEDKEKFYWYILRAFCGLWIALGIFTENWILFMFYLLFNFMILTPMLRISKSKENKICIYWINAVVSVAFWVAMAINHFFFHFNFVELIISSI